MQCTRSNAPPSRRAPWPIDAHARAWLALLALGLGGCGGEEHSVLEGERGAGWPLVCVVEHEGFGVELVAAAEGRVLEPSPDLRLAVWEDGEVLLAREGEPGVWRGNLAPQDVAELRGLLADVGFFRREGMGIVFPDGSYTEVVGRRDGRCNAWLTALRDPERHPERARFLARWRELEYGLEVLAERVAGLRPLAEGEAFRGYDPAREFATAWWRCGG